MSRFSNHQRRQYAHHDEANIRRATAETEDHRTYTNTPAGDTRKLRGIPAIGKGVRGAIPGTTPGHP